MYSSEKKTIVNILVLYLTSTILLVSIIAYGYYHTEKEKLQEQEKLILLDNAKNIYNLLQDFHHKLDGDFKYPIFNDYSTAIYDIDKNLIHSNLVHNRVNLDNKFYYDGDYSYFIYDVMPYYMGVAYIVIEKKDHITLKNVGKNVILLTIIIILIIILTSWFLVRLILKPIRTNLKLIDRFVKDVTHELNTPVSTIITNIELLNSKPIDIKLQEKVNRIKTASLTISNIYEDLVFVVFNRHLNSKDKNINLNKTIEERVEYFQTIAKSKAITINLINHQNSNLLIDYKKFCRLFDNILSNAIKYSNRESSIFVNIYERSFTIIDSGKGMTKAQIGKIFHRYTRFDETQGGFGLGYNIIYTIVKEYKLKIKIESKINEGTCVKIYW